MEEFATENSDDVLKSVTSSFCRVVARARTECFLQYLNGAAPIVYGIPCLSQQHIS